MRGRIQNSASLMLPVAIALGSLTRNGTIGSAGWNGTTPPSVRAFLIPKPARSVRRGNLGVLGANGPIHSVRVRSIRSRRYRAGIPTFENEEQT
jgi:hypothetical protein